MAKRLNVLIGYECSGTMRRAFRLRGCSAYSNDLKPAEDSSRYHYQCDFFKALPRKKWDIIVLHPECTALAVSGNHVYSKSKPKHHQRLSAVKYIERVWHSATAVACVVVLENPVGVLPSLSNLGKPQQRIQPYDFGHDASKLTCLWLHNCKPIPIDPKKRIPGRFVDGVERWSNQTDSGQNKLGPSDERATERARTYPGIARAVATTAIQSYKAL